MIDHNETELCKIFYKNGADKCLKILHSYSPVYHNLLKDKKIKINSLLEIGVGTNNVMNHVVGEHYKPGASLRSWKEYLPNSKIFGIDIDKAVLFEEERIKCFYGDQSSENSLKKAVENIFQFVENQNFKFDVIVDDGSHIKEHMILSYNVLTDYLQPGGIYIIEDIRRSDLNIFMNIKKQDMKIMHVHHGNNDWDDFIAYEKSL